jgi:serine/threonine protein kinase
MSLRGCDDENYRYVGGVQRTSGHLGDFMLRDDDGVERGRYRHLHDPALHDLFGDNHTLYQEHLPFNLFSQKVVKIIGEKLGRGGFGTAYRCEFRGIEYVIKLPNDMLDMGWISVNSDGFLTNNSSHRYYFETMMEYAQEFKDECNFNEMAVDSYTHRTLRQNEPGSRLPAIDHEEYMSIKRELDRMKLHEGYEHIHKILGFVGDLPAIFSEPCSGSLQCLIDANSDIFLGGYLNKLPYQWLELAKQIGNAVEYLRDIARVVHLDIKPGNILYNESKDANGESLYNWKLSDFGLCKAWDRDSGYTTDCLPGTLKYLPRILRDAKKTNTDFVCDAYESSLHSYMATLIMSIKFDIRDGAYLQTMSRFYGIENKDVVDYVISVPQVLCNLQTAKAYGKSRCINGDDYVYGGLAKMLFSKLSEKPGLFLALLDSIKQELSKRQGRGIVGGPAASLIEYQGSDDGSAPRRQRSSSDHGSLGHVSRRSRH